MNPLATMTADEYDYVTTVLRAKGYTLHGDQTAANARAVALLTAYRQRKAMADQPAA